MSARETVEDVLRANGLPVEPLSDFDVRTAISGPDMRQSLLEFVHARKGSLPVKVTQLGVAGFCWGVPQ